MPQHNEALQTASSAMSQRLRFVAESDVVQLRRSLSQRRPIAFYDYESFGHGQGFGVVM